MGTMKRTKFFSFFTVFMALFMAAVIGCSRSTAQNSSAAAVKTIVVATAGMPNPFSFVDDDGNVHGIDPEICEEIDKILPQYEFKFEVTEFPSVLGGLDSGKYQIGANSFTWTAARAEKYIFSIPIYESRSGFIVRPGYTEIKKLEDIGGKRTGTMAGSAMATFLEGFNASHKDNPVLIEYAEGDEMMLHQKLLSGSYDFVISNDAFFPVLKALFQIEEDYVSLSNEEAYQVSDPRVYLLIENSAEGKILAEAVNGAVKTLSENGTISAITKKYVDVDLVSHYDR
jgi:polar amino acid transport system substrate-binding protein